MTSSKEKIVLGGCLTGLGTGLSWSVFMDLVSRDQLFDGQEFALSLILPLLVGLAVGKSVGVQRRVLLPIAFLTWAMPVFGMGFGGANVLETTTGGAIGGLFWAVPFVLSKKGRLWFIGAFFVFVLAVVGLSWYLVTLL